MKNILIGLVLATLVTFSTTVFAFETGDMVEVVNGPDKGLVAEVKATYILPLETKSTDSEEDALEDTVTSYYVYTVTDEFVFHGMFTEEDLQLVE